MTEELAIAPSAEWKILGRAGGGSTSTVWRARHVPSGRLCALKVVRHGEEHAKLLSGEAALLARVSRRWGPTLLGAGPGFLATEWTEGHALSSEPHETDRPLLAAVVAHALGRALEELHDAGVVHGDVKPANVLLTGAKPARDAAEQRGATLIDFGLARNADATPLGGTPRYAAPELRASGEAGVEADVWALGLLLAEMLEPALAGVSDPAAGALVWARGSKLEPARWVEALLSTFPGGRAPAAWIASKAAHFLGLRPDEEDMALARTARVRRAYLHERARDVAAGRGVSPVLGPPVREWLEQAIAVQVAVGARPEPGELIEPLTPVRRARWLVDLVGVAAASWPLANDGASEGDLAARALSLARVREPASWTWSDLRSQTPVLAAAGASIQRGDEVAHLVRELGRPSPDAATLSRAEDVVASEPGALTLAVQLAGALLRAGEAGRAWAAVARGSGPEADSLRAEIARRRGDLERARFFAERACGGGVEIAPCWAAKATLARMAWDAGDLASAARLLEGARGPAAAEVQALIAWTRGRYREGIEALDAALWEAPENDAHARLEGVRGLLALGLGAADAALLAFARAAEWATRAGAVVEEATYLTSLAAAASDAGDLACALESATRSALLWERLHRPERAARAWLARAAALSTVGATTATDEAAGEALSRAGQAKDSAALAYARWAQVEVRAPGDVEARAFAIEAAEAVRGTRDELRARARLLVWAPDRVDEREVEAGDAAAPREDPAGQWDWWGARARSLGLASRRDGSAGVLAALAALVGVPAPLGSRGPALFAGAVLAKERGDGGAARRFEEARAEAVAVLRKGTPPHWQTSLSLVAWAEPAPPDHADIAFVPAQVAQLEAIVRALSGRDRLRPLLDQVLDTLVLWTGVERGLLLLRAPNGKLVPRAARNLARADLSGEQLALSQSIARRALEAGDAVVATDAFAALGDLQESVHALRLRSVLAIPLLARGEALGVVYLDDRMRRGAFGPRELAWVRVVASQAAVAIADARDAALLRRSVRSAERARARLEVLLGEREAELDVTRTKLELAQSPRETRFGYDQIAGRSEPMRALLRLVDRVTASDVPVLVVGESGTGKELIARAIHKNGPRSGRAFVSENCGSVPETLLESTLFGHVRGAFTGASSTRAGLFDVADGGTFFLDEIGEMPLAMQTKLLRVLQEGEVRAVGSERVRKVDVRVIGATHRDLAAMVASGAFREDLLYRLNVVTLRVPPLRERPEDIPVLVTHLVQKHAPGREVRVTRAAMAKLAGFAWPGNVRQLENEIRRALVLGEGAVDVPDLSADVQRGAPSGASGAAAGLDLRTRVDALESQLVEQALTQTRGNQTRAAELLGLSRFGLQKMMKRLGIANRWGVSG